MKEIMFFDANCRLGRLVNGGPYAEDAPALLREMDHYGVDKALVRFNNLAMSGTNTANRNLAELLKADTAGRLTGVWCILPSQCDEIPEPDEFFRQMKANRIGAITLLPFDHRYVPCRMTLGKMMDAAAERRIPVLLNGFAAKWPELYRFMEDFPPQCLHLPGILREMGQRPHHPSPAGKLRAFLFRDCGLLGPGRHSRSGGKIRRGTHSFRQRVPTL